MNPLVRTNTGTASQTVVLCMVQRADTEAKIYANWHYRALKWYHDPYARSDNIYAHLQASVLSASILQDTLHLPNSFPPI